MCVITVIAIILIIVSYTDPDSIIVIASNFLDMYNLNTDPNSTLEPQNSNMSGNNSGPDGGPSGGGPDPNNSALLERRLDQEKSNRDSSSSKTTGISSTSADVDTEKKVKDANFKNVLENPSLWNKDKSLELEKLYLESTQ